MSEVLTPLDQLFASPFKRRFKVVTLPVSQYVVRIRSLNEKELSAHQMAAYGKSEELKTSRARVEDATRRFIALCLCDVDGNRLLSPEDAPKLAEWDAADTSYLYNECRQHVRVEPGDIEAHAKN